MKKSILSLGKALGKAEQKEINGGKAHYICTTFLYVGAPCNGGNGICALPYSNADHLICSYDEAILA